MEGQRFKTLELNNKKHAYSFGRLAKDIIDVVICRLSYLLDLLIDLLIELLTFLSY